QLIIREYLASKSPKGSNSSAQRLAQIVGGHHGVFPTSVELNSPEARFAYESEHESWRQARTELLAHAEQLAALTESDWTAIFTTKIPDTAQALLNGYLIVCDWIASDEHLFPYDNLTRVFDAEQRAAHAIHHLNFGDHWHPHFPD